MEFGGNGLEDVTRPAGIKRRWKRWQEPHGEDGIKFRLMSYNLLADELAIKHARDLYPKTPEAFLAWKWRWPLMLDEIDFRNPDVLCLQEVDHYPEISNELQQRGYEGMFVQRTGEHGDGCATFWKNKSFSLIAHEAITFQQSGLRDNVALLAMLMPTAQSPNCQLKPVLVANTHILFNTKRGDVKLAQIRILIQSMHRMMLTVGEAFGVIAGDFNSTPGSGIYRFLTQGRLDCAEYECRRLSGQMERGDGRMSQFPNAVSMPYGPVRPAPHFAPHKFNNYPNYNGAYPPPQMMYGNFQGPSQHPPHPHLVGQFPVREVASCSSGPEQWVQPNNNQGNNKQGDFVECVEDGNQHGLRLRGGSGVGEQERNTERAGNAMRPQQWGLLSGQQDQRAVVDSGLGESYMLLDNIPDSNFQGEREREENWLDIPATGSGSGSGSLMETGGAAAVPFDETLGHLVEGGDLSQSDTVQEDGNNGGVGGSNGRSGRSGFWNMFKDSLKMFRGAHSKADSQPAVHPPQAEENPPLSHSLSNSVEHAGGSETVKRKQMSAVDAGCAVGQTEAPERRQWWSIVEAEEEGVIDSAKCSGNSVKDPLNPLEPGSGFDRPPPVYFPPDPVHRHNQYYNNSHQAAKKGRFAVRSPHIRGWEIDRIEIATGRKFGQEGRYDFVVTHPLRLKSTYWAVRGREPKFTTHHNCTLCAVDFVFFTSECLEGLALQPIGVLEEPRSEDVVASGMPSKEWPSDHVSLVVDFWMGKPQNGNGRIYGQGGRHNYHGKRNGRGGRGGGRRYVKV